MCAAATAIEEVEDSIPADGVLDDANLAAARERLKRRLADVVKETHDHFGDPLGMMMVYVASGENAEKTVLVNGDAIETVQVSSATQAGGAHA
jgi:hypothetical protein